MLPKPNKYLSLLIILLLFVTSSNFIWLKVSEAPPIGDGLGNIFTGINFYLDIAHLNISSKNLADIFQSFSSFKFFLYNLANYIKSSFPIYPPLLPVSFSLFYFLFGLGSKMEVMTISFYLSIALLSIYGIGKKILNGKAGFLAAFIFSSFPGVIAFSRTAYVEFVLMCLVALTALLLLKTEYFRNRKYSMMFGISLGLTALTKWEFIVFLIGPFILSLWRSGFFLDRSKDIPSQSRILYKNFIFAIIIGVVIASLWYFVSFKDIIYRLFKVATNSDFLVEDRIIYNSTLPLMKKFSFYPLSIINIYISFFYFLLVLTVGIVFACRIIGKRHQLFSIHNQFFYVLFFASWILVPFVCYSLLKLHAPSHIMPVLPAIAIIISIGILNLQNRIARLIIILLIVFYGLSSHLHSFVNFGKFDFPYRLKLYLGPQGNLSLITSDGYYFRDRWERSYRFYVPYKRNWKIKEILSFIKEDSRRLDRKPVVLALCPHIEFCNSSFQYYNLIYGYQLFIAPYGGERCRFDYVVIARSGEVLDEANLAKLTSQCLLFDVHKIDEFTMNFFRKYILIKKFRVQEYDRVEIYKLVSG